MIGTERLYGEMTGSTETLAELAAGADLTRPVPTCPDWTMRQLITHVGRAHRWAAAIVATRPPSRSRSGRCRTGSCPRPGGSTGLAPRRGGPARRDGSGRR